MVQQFNGHYHHHCYFDHRLDQSFPANRYAPLDSCLPPLPSFARKWPSSWPDRLDSKPRSLISEPDAVEIFNADNRHWSALVSEVYLGGLDINWSSVRSVMDMNTGYGGFAAAPLNLPLWVMNAVPIHETDALSVIFDRWLIRVYHDWCDTTDVAVEMDRVLRPGGYC
ncbi:unnamed protein product [Fraxinus pennsylvanica]|uniref:Methyltransferase n=1 Tax=Fraxinus pennsylvanica TaxID=56036 RepID=A0AAD1ZS19_9LAMI|nr:unnamed protein product [Fraxinus pennsylvanica]